MYQIALPINDWSLTLLPRFAGLASPWQELAILALAIVPVLLLFWLYFYEMRMVSPVTATVLFGSRFLLILSLWFVIAFQPTLARSDTEEIDSQIVIAIDQSGSMGVSDPQRSTLEKLWIAKTLQAYPKTSLPVDRLVDDWILHYQKNGEKQSPPWASTIAANASANDLQQLHNDVCTGIDKMTRSEITRGLLEAKDAISKIRNEHKLEILTFDTVTRDIPSGENDPFVYTKTNKDAATNLHSPLVRVLETTGTNDAKTLGVLLFSDGRSNHGESALEPAKVLSERAIPIFPIAIAGENAPPDIQILTVTAPSNVFKDASATIDVRVRVNAMPAQDLIVELQNGDTPVDEDHKKTIQHDGKDKNYTVRFAMEMKEPGLQKLRVRVRPANKNSIEMSQENNERTAVVRVADDKAKVLLVDGEARWEFHYLINAVRRDKTIKPEAVVFEQPRINAIPEKELKESDHPSLTFPDSPKDKEQPDPLWKYECIVLGDVSNENLTLKDRQRLEKYVAGQGGTLVIVAGKNYMPKEILTGVEDLENDPLIKMLPVEDIQEIRPKNGFQVHLSKDGITAPYMQLHDSMELNASRWNKLPKHYWAMIGKARPGATPLAYVRAEETGLPLDNLAGSDEERNNALIVMQNYGFGRVLYVGLDSTWRWRYRVGDLYHHRFWGQVIRWAAADRLLPAGNEYVRFGARQPVYDSKEEVRIAVRLGEKISSLKDSKAARVRLIKEDAKEKANVAAIIDLQQGEGGRLLTASTRELPAGNYRIELDIPELKNKLPKLSDEEAKEGRASFTVLPSENDEMYQLAADWTLLNGLAATTNGTVIPPQELENLLNRFAAETATREQFEEQRIWRDPPLTWYLLAFFLVFITIEWVIRKMVGLP